MALSRQNDPSLEELSDKQSEWKSPRPHTIARFMRRSAMACVQLI